MFGTKSAPQLRKIILFNKLNCSNWSHNFGWVGQAKTPLNAEAKQVSMPAELYEGLKTRKLWSTDGQPPAAIIAGIDIDMDAKIDLIALDTNGILYLFNHELIFVM